MARVFMYGGFERFWHWAQTLLILVMLVTGFNIHGSISLLSFEQAVDIHLFCAWSLIGLWILAWFWHLTTGEWKQYIPAAPERILAMMKFYALGIFQGKPHPFDQNRREKHNPLQRSAYLGLHLFITPAIWISGLLYLFYTDWPSIGLDWLPLGSVALIHTGAAFLMLVFLVAHLYFTITTSEKPFGFVKAMITGYEEKDD